MIETHGYVVQTLQGELRSPRGEITTKPDNVMILETLVQAEGVATMMDEDFEPVKHEVKRCILKLEIL